MKRLQHVPVVLYLAFCALVCAPTSSALAAGASYEELIQQAVLEFEASHWEEARMLFRRAHEQNPSARTWRGMGITAFELRRYVDAVAELEAALADPRKPLTEQQRAEVQSLLQRAREFVSVYRVRVRPGSAEVWVDGAPAHMRDGQIFLDPGKHVLSVRAPGYAERRAELKVDAGEHDEMAVELEVEGQAAIEPEPPRTTGPEAREEHAAAPTPPPARVRRPVTWALLGAAVVALPTAIGVRVAASKKSSDVRSSSCLEGDTACTDRVERLTERGERQELTAAVMFGVSGALMGGAVLSYFLEGKPAKNTTLAVGPRSLLVSYRF